MTYTERIGLYTLDDSNMTELFEKKIMTEFLCDRFILYLRK
jgi:hypothetical protein